MSVSLKKPGKDDDRPVREYTPEHVLTEEQAAEIYSTGVRPKAPVREYTPGHIMDESEAQPESRVVVTKVTKTRQESRTHIRSGALDIRIETTRESAKPVAGKRSKYEIELDGKIDAIIREERDQNLRTVAYVAALLIAAALFAAFGVYVWNHEDLLLELAKKSDVPYAEKLATCMTKPLEILLPTVAACLAIKALTKIFTSIIKGG